MEEVGVSLPIVAIEVEEARMLLEALGYDWRILFIVNRSRQLKSHV